MGMEEIRNNEKSTFFKKAPKIKKKKTEIPRNVVYR